MRSYVILSCITEAGFPNATGLAFQDGDSNPVLLQIRKNEIAMPEDGWKKPRRVFIVQEPEMAITGNQASTSRSPQHQACNSPAGMHILSINEVLHNLSCFLVRSY